MDRASTTNFGLSSFGASGRIAGAGVSGIHIVGDLTLGLGKVVHDYLA
jgi:hypothetical protein